MNTVYLIPNYECNLNCLHCKISKMKCEYDLKKFMQAILLFNKDDNFILFGGEPILHKERCLQILNLNVVKSISTNLLLIDTEILSDIAARNIKIATSWNLSRFSHAQFDTWIQKLMQLREHCLTCIVMITLTPDLVLCDSTNALMKALNAMQSTNAVEGILFEQYIGNDVADEFYCKCDDWLCEICNNWKFNFKNMILDKVKNWQYDCSNVYTIAPNGNILHSCPHNNETLFNAKCLTCKYANICKPCKLHNVCTFPKHLYELLCK